MLRTLKALDGMTIKATDGEIGRVTDAYFDDQLWTVRYLAVNTGGWLSGRKVLVSPLAVDAVEWGERCVRVVLTREQVRGSPDIDTDKPVSRQHETAYFDYYGYPYYWSGGLRWGQMAFPPALSLKDERESIAPVSSRGGSAQRSDPHLRSLNAVLGYHIQAIDDSIGHVDDFLFDERDWSLCFMIVDTRNWLPGRHVILAVDWAERVSWDERKIHISLTRDAVRESPQWDSQHEMTADEEQDYLLARNRKYSDSDFAPRE